MMNVKLATKGKPKIVAFEQGPPPVEIPVPPVPPVPKKRGKKKQTKEEAMKALEADIQEYNRLIQELKEDEQRLRSFVGLKQVPELIQGELNNLVEDKLAYEDKLKEISEMPEQL